MSDSYAKAPPGRRVIFSPELPDVPVALNVGADVRAQWLRDWLGDRDIRPQKGSDLDRELRALAELGADPHGFLGKRPRERWNDLRAAVSLDVVIRGLHRNLHFGVFDPTPYLDLFTGGPIGLADPRGRTFKRAGRVWELVVACSAGRVCEEVVCGEPDLVCRAAGSRFGIACKIALGGERRFRKLVRHAVRQVGGSTGSGFVVMNVSELVPSVDEALKDNADPRLIPNILQAAVETGPGRVLRNAVSAPSDLRRTLDRNLGVQAAGLYAVLPALTYPWPTFAKFRLHQRFHRIQSGFSGILDKILWELSTAPEYDFSQSM